MNFAGKYRAKRHIFCTQSEFRICPCPRADSEKEVQRYCNTLFEDIFSVHRAHGRFLEKEIQRSLKIISRANHWTTRVNTLLKLKRCNNCFMHFVYKNHTIYVMHRRLWSNPVIIKDGQCIFSIPAQSSFY